MKLSRRIEIIKQQIEDLEQETRDELIVVELQHLKQSVENLEAIDEKEKKQRTQKWERTEKLSETLKSKT